MEWMTEAPWVLGTYMLERELSNAFISVTADGVEPRRAMDTAVKRINRETFRKLEEFGYEYDEETGESNFPTPTAEVVEKIIEEYNQKHAEAAGPATVPAEEPAAGPAPAPAEESVQEPAADADTTEEEGSAE